MHRLCSFLTLAMLLLAARASGQTATQQRATPQSDDRATSQSDGILLIFPAEDVGAKSAGKLAHLSGWARTSA